MRKIFGWPLPFSQARTLQHLLILILLASAETYSQEVNFDSLNRALNGLSKVDRCDAFIDLVYRYTDVDENAHSDAATALYFAGMALDEAKQTYDTLRFVKAGRLKSAVFRRLNMLDSSIMLASRLLPMARRHNYVSEIRYLLNGLGSAHVMKAFYDKALECFFELLSMEDSSARISDGIVLQNIGFVFYRLKDYPKSLEYSLRALRFKRDNGENYAIDQLVINLALCYAHMGILAEAKDVISELRLECESKCSKPLKMQLQFAEGFILLREKKLMEAEKQFIGSYTLAKDLRDSRFQLDNILLLSQIYIKQNRVKDAENYISAAEKLVSQGIPYNHELIKIYSQLSQFYARSSNLEKTVFYQSKYIQLRDSLYGEDLTTNLMKIEATYLEKESKARIESQNKILVLKEEVIHKQKIVNVSIGGLLIVLLMFAVILAKNNRQKRKMNQLLDQKVKERTIELETQRDALHRSWQERNVLIKKASSDIFSSIATIKGLSWLGKKEMDQSKNVEYWQKLDDTSDHLSTILNSTLNSNKVNLP